CGERRGATPGHRGARPGRGRRADVSRGARGIRFRAAAGTCPAREVAAGGEYGERYRAARLLVDMIPFLDPELRPPLAEEAGADLERMGAVASASEARSYA